MKAAAAGHTESVQFLLDRGTNIEEKDKNGCTAAILAAQHGSLPVLKLLVDNGVSLLF